MTIPANPSSPASSPSVKVRTRKPAFRPDIQGLRAVAVLSVMANHLLSWPSGGYVGVDVFFVISGFLITGILLREHETTGSISFRGFYVRRVRRIVPAAVLVLAATVVVSVILVGRTRAVGIIYDALSALLFAANWRMAAVGTDYFQVGLPPSPLQHYWSLSVEEQFYFVWPLLLVVVLALGARARLAGGTGRVLLGVVLGVVICVSFAWALFDTKVDPTVAYFSTFSRGWELAVGALVAVAAPMLGRLPQALRPYLGWLGLAGILCSLFLINSGTPFPAPGALLPVVSAAAVIAAGIGTDGQGYRLSMFPLTNRVATYVGDISYSLYLWHFPIIVLALAVLPAGSKKYLIGCALLSVVLAVATYHFIETPIRRSTWLQGLASRTRPATRVRRTTAFRVTVAASSVAAALVIALSIVTLAPQSTGASSEAARKLPVGNCVGAEAAGANWSRCADVVHHSVIPAIGDLEQDTAGAYACWRAERGAFKTCRYGSTRPDATRIALVGDSHAAMLIPALMPGLLANNWSLDTYVGYGCQWRDDPTTDCAATMRKTQSHLLAGKYDAVITTSARWTNGSHPATTVPSYLKFWAPVAAGGAKVIVVDDLPTESADALDCVARVTFNPVTSRCGTTRAVALKVQDPLPLAAARLKGAAQIDLTDFFCDASCPAVIGGVVVYRDSAGHMTGSYSKTLSPFLLDRIQKVLPRG